MSSQRTAQVVAWSLVVGCLVVVVLLTRERLAGEAKLKVTEDKLSSLQDAMAAKEQCQRELTHLRVDAEVRDPALALLAHPDTQIVTLAAAQDSTASARALVNVPEHKLYAIARGLAPQKDHAYVLWLKRGDKTVTAGPIHAQPDGTAVVAVDGALIAAGAPDGLIISLEAAGAGADEMHGPIVLASPARGR